MMNPFFCLLCSRTSFLDERFRCIHCGNGLGSRTVDAENLNLPLPEPENASPGWYVSATNAGSKMSEEYFTLKEETREVNNQMLEKNSNLPLQIPGRHVYENCLKSNGRSQNQAAHDFDQCTSVNQNSLLTNLNTNEGEFQNRSYDICNAETSMALTDDKIAASQQTYLCERSSIEGENENSFDELLGTKEHTKHAITPECFVFTDSLTLDSEYPVVNLFSDSSKDIVENQDEDDIPPSISSFSRKNTSVKKYFQGNSVTASRVAHQKPQTSSKLSRRWCERCGKYFMKEWTFSAHLQFCNPRKTYKCGECGEISRWISAFLSHRRMHTGEKPFKCTQCDYASERPDTLKNHMKTHAKK